MSQKYIQTQLFKPVSGGSLVAFRVLFGVIMLWEVWRYFRNGWIERYWSEPVIQFTYEWFHWVRPLSPEGMQLLFLLMGLLAVFVAAGFLYRVSITMLFLIFTYTFLLEQTRYLNHFYLVILLNFLMIFIPAHRSGSADAWLFPKIRRAWTPGWTVMLLQFQIGIVYLFGGIAKLNNDWLSGSPMDAWLPRRSDFPVIGQLFENPEMILFMSYSGLLLDLVAFPLLMYRKTRPVMAAALMLFHFMNDRLFTIGIFPWFMIGALTIFLKPSWPQEFTRFIANSTVNRQLQLTSLGLAGAYIGSWFHGGFSVIPFITAFAVTLLIAWDLFSQNKRQVQSSRSHFGEYRVSAKVMVALAIWMCMQVFVPLRHFVIPGNPSWTEEGHRFAWHMKLRSKSCNETFFIGNESTGEADEVNGMPFLENWQRSKVSARPQLVIQYADYLSDLHNNAPVYADIVCSLNGGAQRQLISPDVDLTQVTFHDWKMNKWILR